MNKVIVGVGALLLVACGGGGGSSDRAPKQEDLARPTMIRGTHHGNVVTVTWEAAEGADSYHIYFSTDPDMTVDSYAAHGGEWLKDVTSPHDVTIQPGEDHYFWVTAIHSGRESRPSRSTAVFTRYTAVGDVVIDHHNGIEWQRCVIGMVWDGETCIGNAWRMDHTDASVYEAPDSQGWRLPTYDQLHSLVYCSSGDPVQFKPEAPHMCKNSDSPVIYPLFPNTPDYGTYTRPLIDHRGYVCGIGFGNGRVGVCAGEIKPGVPAGLAMIVRLSRDIAD